jgi:hypothetical protein
MNSVANPFSQYRRADLPERVQSIRFWTHQNLPLTEETIVSVSEFSCNKPTCPNRQTVIFVMAENAPTKKMSIHKSIADVCEADVFEACLDLLRDWPS